MFSAILFICIISTVTCTEREDSYDEQKVEEEVPPAISNEVPIARQYSKSRLSRKESIALVNKLEQLLESDMKKYERSEKDEKGDKNHIHTVNVYGTWIQQLLGRLQYSTLGIAKLSKKQGKQLKAIDSIVDIISRDTSKNKIHVIATAMKLFYKSMVDSADKIKNTIGKDE
ncbi:uncharacterized protein LOC142985202 [Anticarsia gemmatalis]|uniref:uncharacterized protein LOC142985202 n=1 Tax=Anticarsia gemmatalis TaxID=129554 RepID=UPI003F76C468